MIKRIFLLPILFTSIYLLGCADQKSNLANQEKPTLTSTIIKQCIDSTFVLDSAINTKSFCVDISLLEKIAPVTLSIFLGENKNIKLINLDSLVELKSDWLQNEFKKNDVIRFDRIEERGDSLIINTTKNRYVIASFGTEIIFKLDSLDYKCLSSEITWIY